MITAKKQFGQNFLQDETILNKIIQAIPENISNIVEIGPGLGDLTFKLLQISSVKSYEIDCDLISWLKKTFDKEIREKLRLNLAQRVKIANLVHLARLLRFKGIVSCFLT